MCGIAGVLGSRGADEGLLRNMARAIRHRGPDDSGFWVDPAAGIGLAHTRLSIIDLSPAGRQPMTSANGRWVLSYNGEIYNRSALRYRLECEGRTPPGGWRGHSDTETLVEAISAWGLENALRECVGMFAFAVWDCEGRQLHLARDRFGEKPLYYGLAGRDLVFASELKAIRQHPEFQGNIDQQALAAYAARSVIPAPLSIYSGIFKLPPATIITFSRPDGTPTVNPYWSYRDVVLAGARDPICDEAVALEALDEALKRAIAGQAVADVPVGAFLSGGIDSSSIVALYQAVSGARVKTYTIGFDEARYDESADARRVAKHLGTDHHEYRVGVAEARDVITLLPTIYDEPFADSSQIPTFLVSRFARQDVAVAISGDAGDELFAGYNRHLTIPRLWRRVSAIPRPVRRVVFRGISIVPQSWLSRAGKLAGLGPLARESGKIRKFASVAALATDIEDLTDAFLDEWHGEGSPILGAQHYRQQHRFPQRISDVVALSYADAVEYLPDDVLVKVDRAAMAVSLETRVPFLDHRVAAIAAQIHPSLKLRDGKGKHVLRQLLYRHVPGQLIERPKAGFAIPVGEWIKGPLRDWAESLLDPRRLDADGFWNSKLVRRRWEGHLLGKNATVAIWSVLMFQAWLDEQRKLA